ncbi:MAG: glycosyltransferase family 4 protein [Bacteroidales bacterium]|nr:glycosyltransferase family 4 protein [Bacteroidales bacterium]
MKVLYLIDNYSLGGAQTIVKGILEHPQSGDTSYAYALRKKLPQLPVNNHLAICAGSSSKYSFRPLRFLRNFIMENEIEVIHCQLPRSILIGYLLKRRFPHLRYVIHEQGDVFESALYARLLRIFRRRADGILACSEATRDMLRSRAGIPGERVRVLYNFVDTKRFSPAPLQKDGTFRVAFSGRVERRKGWREFVRMAEFFQEDGGIEFLMAGTGSETGELEKMLKVKNLPNLKYLGFIPDVENFYRSVGLLVIPSHFEPMGMVAIEAMASGVLVLAADVPGLNEVVRHQQNGWCYPVFSEEKLVDSVRMIRNLPAETLKDFRNTAVQSAESFSLEHFLKELNVFYRTLS